MTLVGEVTATTASRPTVRHRGAARRYVRLVGYALPTAITVGVTFTWFAPRGFVAGGDQSPFVRASLSTELWSSWNHQTTGAGSASYAVIQALEVFVLRAAHALRVSDMAAQHALYALCFGLAAFGAAFLAGVWVRRPIALCIAGLIGAFNTYVLVNQPNVLPPLAIGIVGLFTGLLLRAARPGSRPGLLRLCAAVPLTLVWSYLVLNPPLFVLALGTVIAAACAATPLVGAGATPRALRCLTLVGAAALAINLWWIVPVAIGISHPAGTSFTAQTNVAAWGWTQARTSLPAVATLNGHWGWTQPEYYPYSHAMDSGLWPVLAWFLPALAGIGAAVADRARRKAVWILAGLAAVLLFLSKGVHAPFGAVNLWLFQHVPGMWLFRDPMSKFGVLLVLIYAILAAIALDRAPAVAAKLLGARWRRAGNCAFGVLAIGALAFPWPLWNGAVIPSSRGTLPGEHVKIPRSWYQVADLVNAAPQGKALVLPLDPYYQISTGWGYHGVDSVPAQLLKRPALQELPGGYYSATPSVNALLESVQTSLLGGDPGDAAQQLQALGVSEVIVRHDLRSIPGMPPAADPSAIDNAVGSLPDTELTGQFDVANVYQVSATDRVGEVVSTLVGVKAGDPASVAAAVGNLPAGTAATTASDVPVNMTSWQISGAPGTADLTLARTAEYHLSLDSAATMYHPHVIKTPAGSALALTEATTVDVDGEPLRSSPELTVPLTSANATAISVDGGTEVLDADAGPVVVGSSTTVSAYGPTASADSTALGHFSEVGDCDRLPGSDAANSMERSANGVLTLRSSEGSGCTEAPLEAAAAPLYSVHLQSHASDGAIARICLWETALGRCAAMPALSPGTGWHEYTGLAKPDPNSGELQLFLYADNVKAGEATTVQYRDLAVVPLQQIGSAVLDGSGDENAQNTRTLAAGKHVITFNGQVATPSASSFSALQDCNRHDVSAAEAGLGVSRHGDGTVELRAAADSACVWAPVATDVLAKSYAIGLDYRTVSGRPARLCVWEVGPNRCLPMPELDATPGWHHLDASLQADIGTRELDAYLYADGQQSPRTVVEYRRLSIRPDAALTLNLQQDAATPAAAPPRATWRSLTPAAYDVRIDGASAPFTVVLPESFASGWTMSGLPAGWSARHIEVNGYANGWLVSGTGSATLKMRYAPNRWATAARIISGYGLGAVVVSVFVLGLIEVRRRRRLPPINQ